MKIFYFLIIQALLVNFEVSAQNVDDLISSWSVDATRTIQSLTGERKIKFDGMAPNVRDNMRKSLSGRTFSFYNNRMAVISLNINEKSSEVRGSWRWSSVNEDLQITINGTTHSYGVEWDGPNNLILRYRDVPEAAMVSVLFLTKKV